MLFKIDNFQSLSIVTTWTTSRIELVVLFKNVSIFNAYFIASKKKVDNFQRRLLLMDNFWRLLRQ
jgi:hypothetical protein